MKPRERAEALGYRLEQDRRVPGQDRWRIIDLYSERGEPWMTLASVLTLLDRREKEKEKEARPPSLAGE